MSNNNGKGNGQRRIRMTGAKEQVLKLGHPQAAIRAGFAEGARMIQRRFGFDVGEMLADELEERLTELRREADALGGFTGLMVQLLSHHLEAVLFICEPPPVTRLFAYGLEISSAGIQVIRERAHRPRGVELDRRVRGTYLDINAGSIPIVGSVR